MKRLITIILIFITYFAFAQKENKEVQHQISESEIENLHNLANKICLTFTVVSIDNSNNLKERVNNLILDYLSLDKREDNTKAVTQFWNEKSECLICNTKTAQGRNPEHVLKRAVSLLFHREIFFHYLFSFKDPKIDFNAIEIVDGQEETLLDYIDNIIASDDFEMNFNTAEVIKLRKILAVKYDAKTAQELREQKGK